MATTSTQIDILLKARADLAALKSARGELGGLQREIKETNLSLKNMATVGKGALGALGVGLSAGALVSQVKQAVDYGAQITDLSQQARISTDAFQALALSAKDAGVAQSQFGDTLAFFRKSMSEAAAGIGEARVAFKGLGLDARALSKLPLERALELVAKAAVNADDKAVAYGYTLKILGEGSKKLTALLQELGSDGFDAVAESAKRQILSPEDLNRLKEAKIAINDLDTETTLASAKIAIFWTNILRNLRNGEWYEKLGALPLAFLQTFGIVKQGTDSASKATTKYADALKEAVFEAATLAERSKAIAEAAGAYAEAQKFANAYIAERQKMLDEEHKRTVDLNTEAAKLGEEQAKFTLEQLPPLERHRVLQERINALKKEAVGLRGQDDNATFERRLKIDREILNTKKEIKQVDEEISNLLDGYFLKLDKASKSTVLFEEDLESTKKMADEMGWAFQSAFEDAIVEGRKLSEVIKGLAQDILRIVVRKSVTEPIGNWVSDWIKGFKATGGPVSGGSAYIVGERGPELFVPSMSGSIVPNHELMAAGAGGAGETFYFTQNFTGGVTRGEMADIIPQIVEASKSAVLDARRRRQPGFS